MSSTIINLVSSALCWIDPLVSISYLLFALIATTVGLLQNSFLTDLVSHGKTRLAAVTKQRKQQEKGTTSSTRQNRLLQALLHSNLCLVPKKFFLHFYVIGLIALAASWTVYYSNKGVDDMTRTATTATSGLIGILVLHLLRRCQECLFVHKWTSGSHVHVSVYVVGLVHYILLPHVFLHTSSILPCSNDDGVDISPTELRSTMQQDAVDQPSTGWMLAALVCLWAQYQQRRHHFILANLRATEKHPKKDEKGIAKAYRLPMRGWFQIVSCPHYLAEIIIYLSLVAMAVLGGDPSPRGPAVASNHDVSSTFFYRYTCLLAWVVSNLTVSALENQRWYSQNIPNFEKFHRKAIIPFIL
jgi:3-oxo-5-alpha-steroid 4-dehydrogenase 3 / polyprenol reductase